MKIIIIIKNDTNGIDILPQDLYIKVAYSFLTHFVHASNEILQEVQEYWFSLSYIKAELSFIPGTIYLKLVFLYPYKPVRANN